MEAWEDDAFGRSNKGKQSTNTMNRNMNQVMQSNNRKRKLEEDEEGADDLEQEESKALLQSSKKRRTTKVKKRNVMPTAEEVRYIVRNHGGRMLKLNILKALKKDLGLTSTFMNANREELKQLFSIVLQKEDDSDFLILS
eukprot:TRINITY_DN4577_c0_g2_i1.p1 TRINITY_DN4577_c0_g2~~TRINITY_DN4577_c0_g2_i1.p1  ORF type:complete len:140 (-),score=52.64 TRINITY_DN4577_c0_g2_i1:83-502(-)